MNPRKSTMQKVREEADKLRKKQKIESNNK